METNEEGKIQEAQIVSGTVNNGVQKDITENVEKPEDAFVGLDELDEEDVAKKTKSEFRSRLMLVFVLGFLIGIALKTEALKKITIGYDDYLMKIKSQSYNINDVQVKLQAERDAATQAQTQQQGTLPDSGATDDSGNTADPGSAPVDTDGQSDQGGAVSNSTGI
ncbi:MAG: hypothetical protein WC848_05895 [Parcubacteria group bacterium]|jgi:hypothetical protein